MSYDNITVAVSKTIVAVDGCYDAVSCYRGLEAHPTIHDYITIRIMSGYIRMRPSITHLTSDGAVFDDGHFEDFDTIVLATGYEYKFPFLDDKVT